MQNLREVVQAAENAYLDVYAGELEEFAKVRDMRGWYRHLKERWVEFAG